MRGMLILTKIIACVSLVTFLGMTTAANKFFQAAGWFKVPPVIIETAFFTYRYIFVLIEELFTIRDAQRVRLGYSGIKRTLRSIGELAGSTVIRAYDHAHCAYTAMTLRGYKGKMHGAPIKNKLTANDYIFAGIFTLVLLLLLALDTYIR